MVQIAIKHDIANTIRFVDDRVRKQVPFATAKTLTKLAQLSQQAIVQEEQTKFDRPTPYTLKSTYIKPATKQKLEARVYLKGSPLGGGNPNSLAEIINQQFAGGPRIRKRIEKALTRAGLISDNEYVAPGSAAKLDSYGNLSRGQTQQILSQLQAGIDPYSHSSKSARSKANVKRSGSFFWSRGDRLPRGVWMRDGKGVKPILLVIAQPKYKQLINIEQITQRVIDQKFKSEFDAALTSAIGTAR